MNEVTSSRLFDNWFRLEDFPVVIVLEIMLWAALYQAVDIYIHKCAIVTKQLFKYTWTYLNKFDCS